MTAPKLGDGRVSKVVPSSARRHVECPALNHSWKLTEGNLHGSTTHLSTAGNDGAGSVEILDLA